MLTLLVTQLQFELPCSFEDHRKKKNMMKSPGKARKNIVKNMGFTIVYLIWNGNI